MRQGRLQAWVVVLAAVVGFTAVTADARAKRHAHKRHKRHRGSAVARMHPVARQQLAAAMRDMHRHGLRPQVTTAFRTRAQQTSLFRCAKKRSCRAKRGIYAVARPGRSMHEVGLAVDLAGVAAGGRRRRLTRSGAQMVKIMKRHGFAWRYGLRDPAHFEIPHRITLQPTRAMASAHGRRRSRG